MSRSKAIIINIIFILSLAFMLTPSPAAENTPAAPSAGSQSDQLKNMTVDEKVAYWEKHRQERLATLTPEKKKEMIEERKMMQEKMKNLTPEEREKFMHQQHEEHIAKMSPAERAERKAMRDMLKDMSPEERKNFRKQIMEKRMAQMTPEERRKFEERRKAMQERMKNMSPEERKEWRAKMRGMRESMEEPEI